MDIPNSIESFLQFIEPKSRFLLVAIHPNTGEIIAEPFTDYPQGAAWALDWNGNGWNLYWTVNLTRRGLSKKASKADIGVRRVSGQKLP
jgi:hypothetical protein